MTQKVSALLTCEVIILTALPIEFQAVVGYLQEAQEVIHPQGTIYRVGKFLAEAGQLHVAVAQIGMGGGSAAIETERAIHFFHPRLSLFVGIAGGLKDVQLGDVVAATKVYAYESGKVGQTFEARPEVWRASYPLEQRARHEVSGKAWLAPLQDTLPDPPPRAYIGALAAGEKVLASTRSPLSRQLKATYGDALAIEMEGHGFLQAVHVNHQIHGLVIRGISDLIDHKASADAGGSQSRAARHAAAFAFQVLAAFMFSSPSSLLATHAIWNVPYPRNPYFTGREDLLDRLSQQLSSNPQEQETTTRRAALTQPQALQGLGGIGKTQIAVEYAYRSRDRGRYTHILWMNAASEETLFTSFTELAEMLPDFSARGESNQQKLIAAIKRWLEHCQERWLLILDNADEIATVHAYLPRRGNGSILLTTRAHAVGALALPVEVETMGFLEGTHLLLRRAQRFAQTSDEEINLAGNIVIALDHFPLALEQAGAYIEETQCSLGDYLNLYQTHRQALLSQRGIQTSNYPHSVATTWLLSFQKVRQANPAAAELLELCAFLAPDHIPEEMLREGAAYWPASLQQAATDPFTFSQMIEELLTFSLVKRLVQDQALSIHRLVQAVQRDQMEQETQRRWAERVVRATNKVFPDPQDLAAWPQCLRYLDQAQTCYAMIEEYELAFAEAGKVLNRTGHYLYEVSFYSIAEPLWRRALTICEQQSGPDHLDTASCLNNVALLYRIQGKYSEAEPLYRRSLAIREQLLGIYHPDTAQSLNNLASLSVAQGKYAEAEPLFKQALATYEQQSGPHHLNTAKSLSNLASLYVDQGRLSEAEPLYQRAFTIYEQQSGPEHPDTARGLLCLAALYQEQSRYAEAEPLFQRALVICEQQLGPEHLDTARSLSGLASIYQAQGKYAEVEALYQRTLSTQKQRLGPEHPDTARILNDLANFYRTQGRYTEAEPLFQRALAICEQQLGPEHPDTAASLDDLAQLYYIQHKYLRAESLYKRALAIREQQSGPEHPDTAVSLNNLAELYRTEHRYKEAEPLHKRALAIREQQLGPEHPDTAVSLNNLALLYKRLRKYEQAEQLFQRALAICERQLGPEHPDTAVSLNNLAGFYFARGNYTEAGPLYQRALAICEQTLGPEHPTTRRIYRNRVNSERKRERKMKQRSWKRLFGL